MKEFNGIINLDYPVNNYCVYKMISGIENDNSIYIGVTSDPIGRCKQHGQNLKGNANIGNDVFINWMIDTVKTKKNKVYFSILENCLYKEEAFKKEIEYIKHYKEIGSNVLNRTNGGIGMLGVTYSTTSRNKMSSSRSNSEPNNCKKVYVYDIKENKILIFESAYKCSLLLPVSYSTITNRCNQKSLKSYKKIYLFSYEEILLK